MSVSGFHSEWITMTRHRVLLECRAGFPDANLHFVARVAAITCDHNSERARIVKVYVDDHNSIVQITVASTLPKDEAVADRVREVLQGMFGCGNYQTEFLKVEPGRESSDSYDHMEHLSVAAELAANRYKKDLGTPPR